MLAFVHYYETEDNASSVLPSLTENSVWRWMLGDANCKSCQVCRLRCSFE